MSTPKLRFPEFENDGEWSDTELGNLALFVNEKISINQLTTNNYVSTENILPDYAGLVPASKLPSVENATRFKVSDILISNIRPYLKKVSLAEIDGGSSNDVIVVRASSKVNPIYLSYILRNDSFIEYVMNGAKGVKMPRGDISMIKEYPVPYLKPEEQQKIADCLSSLDDLITAQNQKVEALKQHKKGLMQQLFPDSPPAKGEYAEGGRGLVPKLRFPEFENDGEWQLKQLNDFAKILRGGSPRPIDEYITKDVNGLNWLKIGDIDKEAKYVRATEEKVIPAALSKTRVVKPGDLILSNSMSFGRPYILEIQTCIHDGWIAVSEIENGIDRDFLYYQFMTPSSQKYFLNNAAGSGVQNLNADIIKLLPVSLPQKKEQQKIADFLSSIDDLIIIQTQQLEAYKTHKKGLMQQLFPSLDEVDA